VVRAELEEVKSTLTTLQLSHWPALDRDGSTSYVRTASEAAAKNDGGRGGVGDVRETIPTFASQAKDLQHSGMKERGVRKSTVTTKRVTGTSATNSHVKAVKTVCTVDVFVSRLHPNTACSELTDVFLIVSSRLALVVSQFLRLVYESLYSSFHVAISVDSENFTKALDVYMSPESWPSGVFVKRFFKPSPRDGSSRQ